MPQTINTIEVLAMCDPYQDYQDLVGQFDADTDSDTSTDYVLNTWDDDDNSDDED